MWPWNKKAERKRRIEENARRAARYIAEAYGVPARPMRYKAAPPAPALLEVACDFLGLPGICDDVWSYGIGVAA